MKKAASFVLVAVVAMLSLASSAGGTESAVPFRIIAMSHTHPSGQSYSWVCARIKKNVAGRATVTAARGGPSQLPPKVIRWRGTRIVAFKITSAGRYTIKVAKSGFRTVSKSYTVPNPPTPANGPFPCA